MQASGCLFHDFNDLTHFPHHIFSKKCFSLQWGAHFRKTTSSTFDHFFHFFPPQTASKRAFFPIVFALFALLAVPIPIFSLFEPFGILIFAHYLCIFSLRSPVSKNDRMHHTYIFVNFAAIAASLHQTCELQGIFFIFLMPQLTFRFAVFETHIAQICIANTTCKICRMNVLMMSSSCKSPISHCMLPFASLQLHAEHELKGGGVPSPEGLQ